MITFTKSEIDQIEEYGLSKSQVLEHLKIITKGTDFVNLTDIATINNGIIEIQESENLIEKYNDFLNNHKVVKFVPASGAASRMFKSLLSALNSDEELIYQQIKNDNSDVVKFYDNIELFPFYTDLQNVMETNGLDCRKLKQNGLIKPFLEYLLTPKGLNYANLPKAFLKFHNINGKLLTPFQEHLTEAVDTIKNDKQEVDLHFTLSEEFIDSNILKSQIEEFKSEVCSNVKFNLEYSVQNKATDTIATDENYNLFIDDDKIIFRPGGHGSLIHNLNNLDADLVIVKNIDNISSLNQNKEITIKYKKLIAGYLVQLRERVFTNLLSLEKDIILENTRELLSDLNIQEEEINRLMQNKKLLFDKLNRPIRVCGMVKNEGEPGGGPFWINRNNNISLQIIETAQINLNDAKQNKILENSQYFNPCDLSLSITDYKGNKFDLLQYVDNDMAFVADKSYKGRKLKALEWPGLWNGAMADWLTVFAIVPLNTFTPVKTVLDLLRDEHSKN